MLKPIFSRSFLARRSARLVVLLVAVLAVLALGSGRASAESSEGGDDSLTPVDSSSSLTPVADGDNPLTPIPVEADPEPAPAAENAPVYAAIGLESSIRVGIGADGAGCDGPAGPSAAPPHADQPVTFCYTVENLGSTHLTDIVVSDAQLGLVSASLTSLGQSAVLAPGQRVVLFHHATAGVRSAEQPSVVSAKAVDGGGNAMAGLAAATAQGSPGAVLPAPTGLASTTEGTGEGTGEGTEGTGEATTEATKKSAPVTVPAKANAAVAVPADTDPAASNDTVPAAKATAAKAQAQGPQATELAFTGMSNEPWVLAIFGSAFIFFGYTAITAVRRPRYAGQPIGHDQLDELGFD